MSLAKFGGGGLRGRSLAGQFLLMQPELFGDFLLLPRLIGQCASPAVEIVVSGAGIVGESVGDRAR